MIETETTGDVVILTATISRVDISTATRFHEISCAAIQGHKKVLFDLSSVEFMDSTGVGALVGIAKRTGRDGRYAVTGLTPSVRTIFTLLRMDMVFSVRPSKDDAVGFLKQ